MYQEIRHRGCRVQGYNSVDVYSKLSSIRGLIGDDRGVLNAIGQQFLPNRFYVVRDIINALDSVFMVVGENRILDAVAAAFDLQRAVQYDMTQRQIVIEAPPQMVLLR